MDVNRDKYHCVERRQFEALGPFLEGWEAPVDASACSVGPEVAAALANDLISVGIVSERSTDTKVALPTEYPLPTKAIDPEFPSQSRRPACLHAGTFFASFARASRELRRQPFHLTVESVRVRKNHNRRRAPVFDFERMRVLVSAFDRLRWLYPRSYLCLFDSLALIHFLASFRVFPEWVFGVTADPFEAHCWVQVGNMVLNDTVERVSAFTPIMYI